VASYVGVLGQAPHLSRFETPAGQPGTVRSTDGTRIALESVGAGPNVVVVGGALSDRRTFGRLARLLSSSAAVTCYDRRGRGESGTGKGGVEAEVDDLSAVLAHQGHAVRVYGHSSGGILALEAAARGVPMEGLVVYEPPYLGGDTGSRLPGDLRERLSRLVSDGRLEDALVAFLSEATLVSGDEIERLRAGSGWSSMVALAHTLDNEVALCVGQGALDVAQLGSITVPTVVLLGGASSRWAHSAGQAVAAGIRASRLLVVEGQGHRVSSSALAPVLCEVLGITWRGVDPVHHA